MSGLPATPFHPLDAGTSGLSGYSGQACRTGHAFDPCWPCFTLVSRHSRHVHRFAHITFISRGSTISQRSWQAWDTHKTLITIHPRKASDARRPLSSRHSFASEFTRESRQSFYAFLQYGNSGKTRLTPLAWVTRHSFPPSGTSEARIAGGTRIAFVPLHFDHHGWFNGWCWSRWALLSSVTFKPFNPRGTKKAYRSGKSRFPLQSSDSRSTIISFSARESAYSWRTFHTLQPIEPW